MRHVLVAGVGYVGANLLEELVSRGEEAVVVARKSSLEKRGFIVRRIRELEADLVTVESITAEALKGLGGDVYYHLAGKVSGNWVSQWNAHVGLLSRIIDAGAEIGARVVYVSSVLALGRIRGLPRGSLVVEEENHLEPGRHIHTTIYEKTKAEGERLLVDRGRELGGRWCIVRPGTLIGPWAYHTEWRLMLRLIGYGIALSLSTSIPLVYSRDLAAVLADAGGGAFDGMWVNAVAYNEDLYEVYRLACNHISASCRRINVGWLLGFLGSLAPRWTSIAVMSRGLELGYRYASRILDYEWRPLEEAVEDFMKWASSYTL